MAGLKKKKKEKTGSPNIVLVVFLVLFILSNITVGVLLYYALEEKETARKQKVDADKVAKSDKDAMTYYRMLYRDLRKALGDNLLEAEMNELKLDRETFAKGGFDKAATDKDGALKIRKELNDALTETPEGYLRSYPQLLKEAKDERDKLQGTAAQEVAKHEQTKQLLAMVSKKQDDVYSGALDRIKTNNDVLLKTAQKKSQEFLDLTDNLAKLKEELTTKKDELAKLMEDHENALRIRDKELATLRAGLKELNELGGKAGGAGGGGEMVRADVVPLIMNSALGKPLWDHPVGKITRVDLAVRQVVIELYHLGARPELTFTLFGANAQGRAEGRMKGTIEIVKVLDTKSALARITSLFDGEGTEVPLGVQAQGRILRETDSPLREGDLLFNPFWGSHVAIAGLVSMDDTVSSNPADQHRAVMNMVSLLERQGMTVDAYVDLTDGQIRGKITSKTRYLIVGDAIQVKSLLPSLDGDWKGQNIDLNFTGNTYRGEIRIAGADDKVLVNRLNGVIQENGGKRFLPWGNNEAVEIILEDNGKMLLENKALMVRIELARAGAAKDIPLKKEMKEDPPEEKKEGEPAKMNADEKEAPRGRNALILDGMKRLRDDATGKGLVQISAENFLNMVGYRRAMSANIAAKSNFQPFLPYAGALVPAAVQAPREAPPPPMEMEKKDN